MKHNHSDPIIYYFSYIALSAIIILLVKGVTMRIFKTKWFNKWADNEKLSDEAVRKAVEELVAGLFDADLGGHVY